MLDASVNYFIIVEFLCWREQSKLCLKYDVIHHGDRSRCHWLHYVDQFFFQFSLQNIDTGCTTAVLYTLPGSYDKTKRCNKKVMLNILSV